jgi:hypothetical protein
MEVSPRFLLRLLGSSLLCVLAAYPLLHLFLIAHSQTPLYHERVQTTLESKQTWRNFEDVDIFACLMCGHAVGSNTAARPLHNDAYSCLHCNRTTFANECQPNVAEQDLHIERYRLTQEYLHNSTALQAMGCQYESSWWCPFTQLMPLVLAAPTFTLHPVSCLSFVLLVAVLVCWLRYVGRVWREQPTALQRRLAALSQQPSAPSPLAFRDPFSEPLLHDTFALQSSSSSMDQLRQRSTALMPMSPASAPPM